MAIAILGINHASAPVQLRERIAFDPAAIGSQLQSLCGLPGISEAVILSTCNRTEVYIAHSGTEELDSLQTRILQWMQETHALDASIHTQIQDSVYYKHQQDCLQHLLAVACGLDSMVIGEPQIFGQVKAAYQLANTQGVITQELDNTFQFAFRTAKRIRTETGIGNHAVSLASASVQLAHKIFSDFNKHTAILIGAGETIELVAQHLHQNGLTRMVFANRSLENANRLAHRYQAYSISLDDLGSHLAEGDMIFTSTASPETILQLEDFNQAIKKRKRKPMFVVDLAVPRDIDEKVKELENVYLYTIDDLSQIVAGNQKARLNEAEKAHEIVTLALSEFEQVKNIRNASPAIRELREHFEQQRDSLLDAALEKLTDHNAERILRQFAHQLTNRFLHQPTKELRQGISQQDTDKVEQVLNLLLPDEKSDTDPQT